MVNNKLIVCLVLLPFIQQSKVDYFEFATHALVQITSKAAISGDFVVLLCLVWVSECVVFIIACHVAYHTLTMCWWWQ